MPRQAAGHEPVPWEAALDAFLDRVDGREICWWLTRSAALAVRGLDITPRDLDLVVDDEGAGQLGELLAEWLVEPVTPVTDWVSRWWERAFLHARIEWVGGVEPQADEPFVNRVRARGRPPPRGSDVEGPPRARAAPGPPTAQLRTVGFARTGESDQGAHRT